MAVVGIVVNGFFGLTLAVIAYLSGLGLMVSAMVYVLATCALCALLLIRLTANHRHKGDVFLAEIDADLAALDRAGRLNSGLFNAGR